MQACAGSQHGGRRRAARRARAVSATGAGGQRGVHGRAARRTQAGSGRGQSARRARAGGGIPPERQIGTGFPTFAHCPNRSSRGHRPLTCGNAGRAISVPCQRRGKRRKQCTKVQIPVPISPPRANLPAITPPPGAGAGIAASQRHAAGAAVGAQRGMRRARRARRSARSAACGRRGGRGGRHAAGTAGATQRGGHYSAWLRFHSLTCLSFSVYLASKPWSVGR